MYMHNENRMGRVVRRSVPGIALTVPLGLVATGMIGGCPAGEAPGANEVLMRGIAFDPPEITISVGESVTWTNRDAVQHTATSGNPGDADAGSIFRSGLLGNGETFSHTFNEAGEFVYFCEVHPNVMRGAKVIVRQ